MASFWIRASVPALFAALALAGCGDDGGDDGTSGVGGAAGVMGVTGGSAGMMMATGGLGGMGVTGGAGGMGVTGGAGGMDMAGGAGGMGMTGGMGGGGAEADVRPGCEAAVAGDPAALHAAAQMVFAASCGASGSCHSATEGNPRAGLMFAADANLNMLLVDKPACQVPSLMLVKSGGGQAALDGSYVWQKLVSPVNPSMELTGKAAWGMAMQGCDQVMGFGTRMPPVGIDLSDMRLGPIRDWICAGAAGP